MLDEVFLLVKGYKKNIEIQGIYTNFDLMIIEADKIDCDKSDWFCAGPLKLNTIFPLENLEFPNLCYLEDLEKLIKILNE